MVREHHKRSIAKALSWRTLATLDTLILAYIFTGSVSATISIAGLELLTKLLWYYLHERMWALIPSYMTHPRIAQWFERTSRRYSILKTASWRFWGSLDTALIAFIITREPVVSASLGGAELITKIFLYYLHERAWLKIRWGTKNEGELASPEETIRVEGLRA